MFRTMALKELQETRGITLLALAAYGYAVATQVNPQLPFGNYREVTIPFVNDSFFGWLWLISIPMTIALGLRQTLGESIPGIYPFLFHRPAGRRWLIGMKLLVGMSVYLICAALAIVIYGLWAATPGTHAGPFAWSMTVPCWITWFGMTPLYLGAFLTGIRPGRWFRTRILPMAGAALALGIGIAINFDLKEPMWSALFFLAADVWFIATILFVVRTRDYP